MSTMTAREGRHMTPETLDTLLRAAVLAPSSHNTQPWTFSLEPGSVHLYADRTRALPVNDPDDRELIISCGAALFNLRVAAWDAGATPVIELLPDPGQRDLLAKVDLHGCGRPPADVERLHAAIEERRTRREGFADRPVAVGLTDELRAAAHAEGAWLEVADEDARERLADLIGEADRMQWSNRHWRRELAAWMHPRRTGDGLPTTELMVPLTRAVIATLDVGMTTAEHDRDRVLGAPTIVTLDTNGDRPRDWLVAGMALEHVLLLAASQGVQATYLNQPIQVAQLRMDVAAVLGRPCFPQVILQLGYPAGTAEPTRRRPIADVLDSGRD